jgi:hypothetical protein
MPQPYATAASVEAERRYKLLSLLSRPSPRVMQRKRVAGGLPQVAAVADHRRAGRVNFFWKKIWKIHF